MLKYIIAAVVIILAWVGWYFFLPGAWWWIPAIISAIAIGIVLTIVIVRRLRARRAARELEKALAAQAAEQARTARPELQADIYRMQKEFQRSIDQLKNSRLGGNALYDLPWFMIVGPPGSGKSTALRNSGLQFPYTSGGAVKGLGGTRQCDWWLTNEGVLLDTAGRWTTEEDDRDEWEAFLDLIRKFRPSRPLNGIIAAVNVDELGGAHEQEVTALARRMRERIDEVQLRLQMSLPVYVLYTKCDLVPGFVETFTDLSRNERGQIWGFTAPLTTNIGDPSAYFEERFDEISAAVEKRAMRRMGEERKIDDRELIFSFPQQLEALKKSLGQFIGELFELNVGGETPKLRGVYFSSGTQEGKPIDRVMKRMAEAFGIQSQLQLTEPKEARSYFLRDVFTDVVFLDKDAAMLAEAEVRRQRRNQYLIAGGIALAALLLAAIPAWAWSNSYNFNKETDRIIADTITAAQEREEDGGALSPAHIEDLRARTDLLADYNRNAPPIEMRFGMYQSQIFPHVRRFYQGILRRHVLAPMVASDTSSLGEFAARYEASPAARPSPAEHVRNYDRLKLHLLLTRPATENEPNLATSDDADELQEWLANEITEHWAAMTNIDLAENPDQRERMQQHSVLYTELLAESERRRAEGEDEPEDDADMFFEIDDEIVDRTRRVLNRRDVADTALERIIQELEPYNYDIRLENLVGNTVQAFRSDGLVRGAFTRRGFESRVREMLDSPRSTVLGEPWVLGRQVNQSEQEQEAQDARFREVRNQYYRQYVVEWKEFLRSIRVTPGEGNIRTLTNLQDLTRGEPQPYGRLYRGVAYNTRLPLPANAEDSETAEAVGNVVRRAIDRTLQRSRTGRVVRAAIGDPTQIGEEQGPLELDPQFVRDEFDGFNDFGAPPEQPPPAEGETPPPPPATNLNVYEEQLAAVRDALQAYLENPGDGEPLMTSLQTARTRTRALIESQEIGWRPRFEALLWPPIDGAAVSSSLETASGNGRSWCNEVYIPYARNLLEGYPFDPRGHDVSLQDFGTFYMPESGTLWTFYNEVLRSRVPRNGDHFEFGTQLGRQAGSVYRVQLLRYLDRAADITATYFPPGGEEGAPTAVFDARIHPHPRVATQTLSVGGASFEHHNGPEEWTRFTWPGESPQEGAAIEIRGVDGMHEIVQQEGEWGIFRLIEAGTVTNASEDRRVFTITWRLRTHDVDISIDFRPVRGDAPFFGVIGRERNPRVMQPVRATDADPPREIVNGRNTCRVGAAGRVQAAAPEE